MIQFFFLPNGNINFRKKRIHLIPGWRPGQVTANDPAGYSGKQWQTRDHFPRTTETGGDSDGHHETDYIFEPDAIRVLDALTPRYVETQVYHAILEAIASEHSARMVAMQNATDNANELIDDLTLDLNKARQESITSELLDMVGGAAAVGG